MTPYATHNGQQYRVIYNANGDMWARDVWLNPSPKKTTRQPMESFLAKKLIVKSSVISRNEDGQQ